MDECLEAFAAALADVPFWLIGPPGHPGGDSPERVLLSLAEKSFLGSRYRRLVVDEGRYWTSVAADLIARREIPRWVDHRRFEAEYDYLGKGAWIELYHILFGRPLRRILSQAAKASGPVLELGCGCGWLSLEIARLGRDVAAYDASPAELAIARFFDANRHRYPEDVRGDFYGFRPVPADRQGAIEYIPADLNEASLPRGRFSLAISWESLHHLQNLRDLCSRVRTSLAPDGLFLVHETIHEELTGSGLRRKLSSPAVLRFVRAVRPEEPIRPIHDFEPGLFQSFQRSAPPDESGAREVLDSPFEGVTGEEMETILAEHFSIFRRFPRHHFLTEAGGFEVLEDWASGLGRPPSRRLVRWLFRAIKLADDIAIRIFGKRPRHVFLLLRPKPGEAAVEPASFIDRVGRRCGRALAPDEWRTALQRVFRLVVTREDRWEKDLDLYSFQALFGGLVRLSGAWDELLLAGGWYIREGDYHWTNGSAEIHLAFPPGSRFLEIEVMGFPLARPEHPQPLVFRDGAGDICRFLIERSGWHFLRAPLDRVPDEAGVVRIESPTFNPRRDLGEEDGRNLGVALRSIRAGK